MTTAAPQVSIALIAMAGFASGAGMRIMDPLLPLIGQDFGVPTASVSILIAAFMITYGGGQIGTGPAGDRFGKLRVAAIALVLFGIFTIGAEFSGSLTQLALLRAAGGLVSGAVIPLLMAHIGDSVPYHERQAVLGQFLIGNVMSQMLASPISGILGEHLGWRASFLVFGCFTAAIGLPEREVQVERQPHEAQQALAAHAAEAHRLDLEAILRHDRRFHAAWRTEPDHVPARAAQPLRDRQRREDMAAGATGHHHEGARCAHAGIPFINLRFS